MGTVVPFPGLSDEAQALLARLAEARGVGPTELLEELVRHAAREGGLLPPDAAAEPGSGEPFLVLEATEEVPAIGPEGRGRRVHFKAIDETGEWDAGEMFVPDPPRKG